MRGQLLAGQGSAGHPVAGELQGQFLGLCFVRVRRSAERARGHFRATHVPYVLKFVGNVRGGGRPGRPKKSTNLFSAIPLTTPPRPARGEFSRPVVPHGDSAAPP